MECRICQEDVEFSPVVAPCRCTGSAKWLCLGCYHDLLDRDEIKCSVCKSLYYTFRTRTIEELLKRTRKKAAAFEHLAAAIDRETETRRQHCRAICLTPLLIGIIALLLSSQHVVDVLCLSQ